MMKNIGLNFDVLVEQRIEPKKYNYDLTHWGTMQRSDPGSREYAKAARTAIDVGPLGDTDTLRQRADSHKPGHDPVTGAVLGGAAAAGGAQ